MPTNAQKSQKTSDSFGNLHVNDWQENGRKIRINNFHLVFRDLQ